MIELINTGSELLLGRVLNTHQQWLCRQLADLGYVVTRQVAVPDTAPAIEAAVREALARADLVIVSGGLGPTSDDLTRDRVAHLLGKPLREDAVVLAHITQMFAQRRRVMLPSIRVQAQVPEGAIVLHNVHGTAPGLAIEVNPNPFRPGAPASWLILLPGPPRELRPMFTASVVPLIQRVWPPKDAFVCHTLRAVGIGESMVEEKVASKLTPLVLTGLELGYCARPGQVDVRLAARGPAASEIVGKAETIVRAEIDEYVFGEGDASLEETIIRLLTSRRETLAVAESCTGGGLAHRLTNVPGASAVFLGGFVTYSNEAKQKLIGVSAEALAAQGAVSEPVAREMAEGARRQLGAQYALSITGIAGPDGGTEAKPVGTVFIGLAGPFPTIVERRFNPFDRETFKQVTADQAMDLLRRTVGKLKIEG